MPRFFITVASPISVGMKFEYKGKSYAQRFTKQFDFPSLHFVSPMDKYIAEGLTTDKLFTDKSKPKLIMYDEGHMFPKTLKK